MAGQLAQRLALADQMGSHGGLGAFGVAGLERREHRHVLGQALGQPARRVQLLQPGQPLRENMVRAPQAFEAGAQVKVSSGGAGFSISVVGQAVAAGRVGEPARVRLPNGKVVTGLVRADQSVELSL